MRIVEKTDAKILIDEEGDFQNYLDYLKEEDRNLVNDNLIVDLSGVGEIETSTLLRILPFSDWFKKKKNSFVVITSAVDIMEIPENLSVVPTLGEAEDLIQMEEIERDLGF